VVLLIMPVGLVLVGTRLVTMASKTAAGRWLAASGLLIPALLGAFPLLRDWDGFLPLAGFVILVATTLGLPIFAALAGGALLLFWCTEIPIAAVSTELYRLSAQPMLPAVPLFTLAGFILAEGGASRRLMRTFTGLFGWMPGGLAIVTTVLLAFFTPLTGASGVTILSMGGLLLPVLLEARYPKSSSVGLVTVSGSIGLLFVPSLPVILYGVYAKTPIDELFVGGLFPGILLVLLVAGYGAGRGWLSGARRTPFRCREAAAAIWEAKWELGTPLVILAGLFGGFATLVEAAALTVVYALIVECFVYKDLGLWRNVPRILVESATLVGGFLVILAAALGFTNYLIHAEVPLRAMEWVRTYIESPIVFLLALNLLLIVVGALMDIYSAIFVFVPLIAPMGVAYGIDPVHMGIIFLANMELGYLMPPMGENLFLSSYRFKQPLARVYISTAPFVIILLIAVLLITYVPALTLWPLQFFRG
jgi:tripartite ATP-independent transporter DctM subunit